MRTNIGRQQGYSRVEPPGPTETKPAAAKSPAIGVTSWNLKALGCGMQWARSRLPQPTPEFGVDQLMARRVMASWNTVRRPQSILTASLGGAQWTIEPGVPKNALWSAGV